MLISHTIVADKVSKEITVFSDWKNTNTIRYISGSISYEIMIEGWLLPKLIFLLILSLFGVKKFGKYHYPENWKK